MTTHAEIASNIRSAEYRTYRQVAGWTAVIIAVILSIGLLAPGGSFDAMKEVLPTGLVTLNEPSPLITAHILLNNMLLVFVLVVGSMRALSVRAQLGSGSTRHAIWLHHIGNAATIALMITVIGVITLGISALFEGGTITISMLVRYGITSLIGFLVVYELAYFVTVAHIAYPFPRSLAVSLPVALLAVATLIVLGQTGMTLWATAWIVIITFTAYIATYRALMSLSTKLAVNV